MDMVHHQDVTVELSIHLLAAQQEIKSLRIQLWKSDATTQRYQRMVEGSATSTHPTRTLGLPPPQFRVQPRSLRLTATPLPDPVLARSYPKLCQESLACVVF
jgi:hypothetical protein